MKLTKFYFRALTAFFLLVIGISTEIHAEGNSIKGIIYEVVDEPPCFKNGTVNALHDFMERNFVYPREAWLVENKGAAHARVVICTDGKVRQIEFHDVKHPALKAELERVIDKMTWLPGSKNGKVVNCRYEMVIPLQPHYLENTPIPYGYIKIVDKADKYATKLTNANNSVNRNAELDKYLSDVYELFPVHANTTMAFARLMASDASKTSSFSSIDSCIVKYAKLNPFGPIDPDTGCTIYRPGYCGRTEAGLGAMRYAIQQYFNPNDAAESYNAAVELLNKRMADCDIDRHKTRKELAASDARIERLRRDMVQEFARGYAPIDQNTAGWERITELYTLDEFASSLGYWAGKGKINNAQVMQLRELVNKERESMKMGKKAKGELLNLWGARAMLEWIQGGNEAVDAYIAEVEKGEPSKALSKHLAKLRENLDKNADMLADRDAAIQTIACLVPPEGVDAKEFYARRKAVEKVFPLRWLLEI